MHQLVDTPGLLERPMDERNDIEMQAIAALSHVGDLVLFLFDVTEESGTSIEAQKSLREEIESMLGDTPMLTVVGKADLLGLEGWDEAHHQLLEFPLERITDTSDESSLADSEPVLEHPSLKARAVSPVTGVGLRPLRSAMVESIGAVGKGDRLVLPEGWHVRRIEPKEPIFDERPQRDRL